MTAPRLIGFNTETHLISREQVVPRIVCLAVSEPDDNGEGDSLFAVSPSRENLQDAIRALLTEEAVLVAANAKFDLHVLLRECPDMVPEVFHKLRSGQIADVQIREKLLNLAEFGRVRDIRIRGVWQKTDYKLSTLVRQYLDMDISEEKNSPDAWRTNYAVLEDTPVEQWPQEARQYAMDDAVLALAVYEAQEQRRQSVREQIGHDPLLPEVETFRTMVDFCLGYLTNRGVAVDPFQKMQVEKMLREELKHENLSLLIETGILIPAQPPRPYANNAKDKDNPIGKVWLSSPDRACLEQVLGDLIEHRITLAQACLDLDRDTIKPEQAERIGPAMSEHGIEGTFDDLLLRCSEVARTWDEPSLKMTAALPEKISRKRLGQYVLEQAKANPLIEVAYNDPTEKEKEKAAEEGREPKGNLKLDDEWLQENAPADPVLQQYHHRQKLQKLVTTELPRMEYVDEATGQRKTAAVVHANFDCLKETGRTSSFAGDLYPSFNGQNVDPRARGCYVPREGMVLFSIDYNQMELGTAAQTCLNLFGYSELADKINQGFDTHAYLGSHIALSTNEAFRNDVLSRGIDDGDALFRYFLTMKEGTPEQKAFYKTYRTLAKPTGLGYPGGLGPATMVKYAKATYGVQISMEQAQELRDVWLETFPEFGDYFNHINKELKDPRSEEGGYCYQTPLGMFRADARYCAAANGLALQSPSAEGALMGLCDLVQACYDDSRGDELLYGKCFPSIFVHDEVIGEIPEDDLMQERVERMGQYLVDAMQLITPDVRAGYGAALMRRWDKSAEAVYRDGRLAVWEPTKNKS